MHDDTVREVRPPLPEHKVRHVRSCAHRKRGNKNSRCAIRDQSSGDAPRCGLSTIREVQRPSAGHVGQRDPGRRARAFGSEIGDVVDVDLVGADREWFEPVRESVTHFQEHAFEREAQIKRGNADRIEATTLCLRALTGQG